MRTELSNNVWALAQRPAKMDLLGSQMKPGEKCDAQGHRKAHPMIANDPMNFYWDIRELSIYLHVKPSTLYAWAGQGRIPCLKIHGLVRFRRDDIERWVESFRIQDEAIPHKTALQSPRTSLNELIARAKTQAYNSHQRGNQTKSSPIGKEEADGAI